MKYARTEDGKILETGITTSYGYVIQPECKSAYHFIDENGSGEIVGIVKQADIIEDLCDGFVGITTKQYPNRPDIEPSIYYFKKPFELEYMNVLNQLKLKDVELTNQNGWTYPTMEWFIECDIYGFIRTDKGLIYVAKLNNKGELELL